MKPFDFAWSFPATRQKTVAILGEGLSGWNPSRLYGALDKGGFVDVSAAYHSTDSTSIARRYETYDNAAAKIAAHKQGSTTLLTSLRNIQAANRTTSPADTVSTKQYVVGGEFVTEYITSATATMASRLEFTVATMKKGYCYRIVPVLRFEGTAQQITELTTNTNGRTLQWNGEYWTSAATTPLNVTEIKQNETYSHLDYAPAFFVRGATNQKVTVDINSGFPNSAFMVGAKWAIVGFDVYELPIKTIAWHSAAGTWTVRAQPLIKAADLIYSNLNPQVADFTITGLATKSQDPGGGIKVTASGVGSSQRLVWNSSLPAVAGLEAMVRTIGIWTFDGTTSTRAWVSSSNTGPAQGAVVGTGGLQTGKQWLRPDMMNIQRYFGIDHTTTTANGQVLFTLKSVEYYKVSGYAAPAYFVTAGASMRVTFCEAHRTGVSIGSCTVIKGYLTGATVQTGVALTTFLDIPTGESLSGVVVINRTLTQKEIDRTVAYLNRLSGL